MANYSLKAASPLDGIRLDYANLTIEEIVDRALVSIATPTNGDEALHTAVLNSYGVNFPAVGNFTATATDNASVLRLAADQAFIIFDDQGGDPTATVTQRLGQTAYVVDQSDAWVMIRMTGDNCRPALARICPIDLDPANFPPGSVARTSMEHLSAIILCETDNRYILLSPSSSARSFLHAIETSARNVS